MSDPSHPSQGDKASPTDSPWFWMMVFSAASLLALLIIWPQYVKRQRRLEMQFQAREEILRRRAEGEPTARPAGREGGAPPPALGELIIPLWPLVLMAGALSLVSAAMFWFTAERGRRREP